MSLGISVRFRWWGRNRTGRRRENSDQEKIQIDNARGPTQLKNARMPECQNASDAKTEGVNRPSSTSTTSMNPLCEKIAEEKRGARSSQLRPPITPNEWAHQYCTETPAVPSCILRTLAAPSATPFGYNHNSLSSATLAFAPAMHLGHLDSRSTHICKGGRGKS